MAKKDCRMLSSKLSRRCKTIDVSEFIKKTDINHTKDAEVLQKVLVFFLINSKINETTENYFA